MTRSDALRAIYNNISVLDFANKGEPWDELTEDQRGAATTAIEELLPPLLEKPSAPVPDDSAADLRSRLAAAKEHTRLHAERAGAIVAMIQCATAGHRPKYEQATAYMVELDRRLETRGEPEIVERLWERCNPVCKPNGLPFAIVGTQKARAAIDRARHNAFVQNGEFGLMLDVLAHRDHLEEQATWLQHDLTRFTNRARDAEWMLAGMAARMGGEPIESCSFDEGRDETRLWRSGWEQVNSALAEAATRTPTVITVFRRGVDDWQAQLEPTRWEAGRSENDAIAKLVISRSTELGVQVAFTRGDGL